MYGAQNSIFRIKCRKAYFNARASRDEGRGETKAQVATRSCIKIRSARDTNDFSVRCIPQVSRAGVVLRAESWFSAHLKFYRTSAGKSTFRTQNNTVKGNFRSIAHKIVYFVSSAERCILNFCKFCKFCKFLKVSNSVGLNQPKFWSINQIFFKVNFKEKFKLNNLKNELNVLIY